MAGLNETPRGNRVHVAFFGLRNAGKSTLVNAFTGQDAAIVSDVAGTTTDPVSKAMELLPLGPCLVTDTAGLDDFGELGELRVKRSLGVLATADVAVWVASDGDTSEDGARRRAEFDAECRRNGTAVVEYRRGDSVDGLKAKIAGLELSDRVPGLLDGLVKRGDRVLCICPMDSSAPKGRLILPQVQLLRECLDLHATATVCQPEDIPAGDFDLAVTDSQAFAAVKGRFPRLTSFSILFARQKGDIGEYMRGLEAIRTLHDGDLVLVAEGCTHRRQCEDIGTVKIPAALKKLSGRELRFEFASGGSFGENGVAAGASLVVQCGGCMLTRREVMRRIASARASGIPIVNYGMVLAAAAGVEVEKCVM